MKRVCSPTELQKERGKSSFLDEKNKQHRIICHVSVCLACKSRKTTASAIKKPCNWNKSSKRSWLSVVLPLRVQQSDVEWQKIQRASHCVQVQYSHWKGKVLFFSFIDFWIQAIHKRRWGHMKDMTVWDFLLPFKQYVMILQLKGDAIFWPKMSTTACRRTIQR